MITSFSFLHLRGIVGMTNVCRRKIRKLRNFLADEKDIQDKLTVQEDQGNIEGTTKGLNGLLDLYQKEESLETDVEMTEEKVLFELIKDESSEIKRIRALQAEAASMAGANPAFREADEALKRSEAELKDMMIATQGQVKHLIREQMDLLKERTSRIDYFHIMSDRFLSGKAFQEATSELQDVKKMSELTDRVMKALQEVEAALTAKDPARSLRSATELAGLIDEERKTMIVLLKEAFNLVHDLHLAYLHVIIAMSEDDTHGLGHHLADLRHDGFPEEVYTRIDAKYHLVLKAIAEDRKKLFEMARWLGYELQAGQGQA